MGTSCKNKPLHVINHEQIEEVADLKRLYRWFEKAGLKDSRGTNHEQAFSTRSIEANVFHIRQVQAVQRCFLRQTNRVVLFCLYVHIHTVYIILCCERL